MLSFFPVYRVHKRFSIVDSESPLQGPAIGRINLQRQVDNALKLPHRLLHHGRLVDLRKAHVDVQNLGAVPLLITPSLRMYSILWVRRASLNLDFPVGLIRSPITTGSAHPDCLGIGGNHCFCLFSGSLRFFPHRSVSF